MAENFDDFVEKVRDANPIEKVLEESGIHLRGHGRLRTSTKHDSLKVRTDMQRAWWYSQNWNGDVFGWIMKEKGCEFIQAVEQLARRANLDMPRFQAVNESEVKRIRATADAFSVAADVFHRWLVGDEKREIKPDAEALAYARGRWSEDVIKASLTGFSGTKTADQVNDMKGEFSLFGIDPCSPAAVAVLGYEGNIGDWARSQGVRDHPDFDDEWLNKARIHGLMDVPGLIYAHQHHGGVRYLSRRNMPGFDKIKSEGKTRDWKSFNPYKLLAGPKQAYWSYTERVDQPVVCVEGPGDANTWAQWGFGSMAFCGLLGDVTQVAPEEAGRMRKMADLINKHPAVYLQLDADEAGQKAVRLAAKLLGPKVQIVQMSKQYSREDAKADIEETTDAES